MRDIETAILAANAAFYQAFEDRDLDAMSSLWWHTDDVAVVHPGWPVLTGWSAVSASWYALFDGPQRLQFIVTGERVGIGGTDDDAVMAWVSCNENLIESNSTQSVAATNLFRRDGDEWRMVHHHGSPIVRQATTRDS